MAGRNTGATGTNPRVPAYRGKTSAQLQKEVAKAWKRPKGSKRTLGNPKLYKEPRVPGGR